MFSRFFNVLFKDARRRLILATVLALAAASPLLAEPMALLDPADGDPAASQHAGFDRQVEKAVGSLRDAVSTSESCRLYFLQYEVNLDVWLAPGESPFIVPRPFRPSGRRGADPICGGAQNRQPFEVMFIDPGCFTQRQHCDLASLLLHEMGHLARRDTRDHEPRDFFKVCRLSACIDPGRFR